MLSLVNLIQEAQEAERRTELLELNRHIKHLQRELRRARDRRDSLLNDAEREGIDAAIDRVIDGWQPTGSLDQETADRPGTRSESDRAEEERVMSLIHSDAVCDASGRA